MRATTETNFNPDWVSSPTETLVKAFSTYNLSVEDFATKSGLQTDDVRQLLNGNKKIDRYNADAIADLLGGTSDFWLKRQERYEQKCSRVSAHPMLDEWLKSIPTSHMKRWGWLNIKGSYEDKVRQLFTYFDVKDVEEWYDHYQKDLELVQFKTTSTFDSEAESVITWLHQALLFSKKCDPRPFSRQKLLDSLDSIKALSRISDPSRFVPAIKAILLNCGVCFAIIPAPPRCRATGVTITKDDCPPIISLSGRYLTDDHFWFTLFHEIGHLLYHYDNPLLIDGLDCMSDRFEEEANQFAEEVLIGQIPTDKLKSLTPKNWRQIPRLAKQNNISSGIIVGQLQRKGVINYKYLNRLKKRFNKSELVDALDF